MNCPICSGPPRQLFQKHGYWICECQKCRHRYAEISTSQEHVDRVYGDHYFQEGGDGYPDYLGEANILINHGKRYGQLLKKYMEPGKMLDVGAAAGFILKGFQESGWHGAGVEPNQTMAEYARTQFGLDVKTGAFEQFNGDDQFDLVSMIQVVAHFYDIKQAFETAARLTRPGGYWLIETWNKDSWTARIFGKNWHEYSPPSVLHWFSLESLKGLATQFGLQEVARGRSVKRINADHAKSLVQYKLEETFVGGVTGNLMKIIPDNLSIPYFADDLSWALYRKV